MQHFAFVWFMVLLYAADTQQQGFKIPPGSKVEIGQMPAMSRMMMQQTPSSMVPMSGIQQLLNNMLQTALNLRRMMSYRPPLPIMEEPCPCAVECCRRTMEPRRVLPVMDIPMTIHPGCCGCVDCPMSLSRAISNIILMTQRAVQSRPAAGAGGETR